MESPNRAPDLPCAYLPHLDYNLQRFGSDSPSASVALDIVIGHLRRLKAIAGERGYDVLIFGDYGIANVRYATFPNRVLSDDGMFRTRSVRGMSYHDFYASTALAMPDHQIANIFTKDKEAAYRATGIVSALLGVASIFDRNAQRELGIDHPRSGSLLLVAKEGYWFAYPWWTHRHEVPDFATHVDIHKKPGYDPCELFFGWPPLNVSTDTGKVRGSHGSPNGPGAWATTLLLDAEPTTFVELAREVGSWLSPR